MRSISLSIAALAQCLACGCEATTPSTTPGAAVAPAARSVLRGRVLGYDGQALPMGHATLRIPNGRGAELRVPLAADGSFELDATAEGFAWLELTGVGHAPLTMPVVLDRRAQRFVVRLGTNTYRDDFSELRLVVMKGAQQRFIRAQPRSDGRYEAVLEETSGRVQLAWASALSGCCGETAAGRSAAQPPSDGWAPDGAGQYRWSRYIEGRARVVFDPGLLPPPGRDPVVVFDEAEGPLAKVAEIAAEIRRVERAFADTIADAAPQGRRAAVEFRWGTQLSALAERIEAESDARVRRVALAAYFARLASAQPGERERRIARLALAEVPPDDPAWAWGRVATLLRTLGDSPRARAYAAQVVETHPELDVVSQALWVQTSSDGAADEVRARARRTLSSPEFSRTFGGTRLALRRAESGRAPELPTLEFVGLGPDERLSTDSLRGGLHLLSFWATWCEPCIEEMPELHRLHERFGGLGLTIVSVAVDDELDRVAAFRERRWPMPWTHARTNESARDALAETLGVDAELPLAVLVDENGGVLVAGPPHLAHARIERMLAEGDGGRAQTLDLEGVPAEKAEAIERAVRELEAVEAAIEAGGG